MTNDFYIKYLSSPTYIHFSFSNERCSSKTVQQQTSDEQEKILLFRLISLELADYFHEA